MSSKKYLLNSLVLVIICMSAQSAVGAEKYALLIGIDDYSLSDGFSTLQGAENDVALMKNVLIGKGFALKNITVLLNEQATHSRIEDAFMRLSDQAKKEKVGSVYIYYSGHGSQTMDLNGDEKRLKDLHGNILPSFDQTWVTYGSRLKKGAIPPKDFTKIDQFDILDDEISVWLNDIAGGCDQVVFISDSCHSGSVSRQGITVGIRRGPVDEREHPLGE